MDYHYDSVLVLLLIGYLFFFFNDTATTEIYTLSLHDALPISWSCHSRMGQERRRTHLARRRTTHCLRQVVGPAERFWTGSRPRSEEHTSELQSRQYLVCRLLLEKKKKNMYLMLFASTVIDV